MIKNYISLVNLLGTVVPSNVEVVLHDINNLECSIIAIENGHVSGRSVGAPVTDFTLRVLSSKQMQKHSVISGYNTNSATGKHLNSSTFLLKDGNDDLFGLLCFNVDTSAPNEVLAKITELFEQQLNFKYENHKFDVVENLLVDKDDLRKKAVLNTIENYPVKVIDMSTKDKLKVVTVLHEKGIFIMKGMTKEVADMLDVSQATIYRYLKKLDKENK